MLIGRLGAGCVPLHAGGVGDPELPGQVLHHRPRHVQRILQEHAQVPHRGGLEHESEPVVIAPPVTDQRLIGVIQQEEPFQVRPRRHAPEPPIGRGLCIS